jgi:hypothetical protein
MTAGPLRGNKVTPRNALLAGVLVVLAFGMAAGFQRVQVFVKKDPAFCNMCHQPRDEYAMWSNHSHANFVCQECHHQGDRAAVRALVGVVFGSVDQKNHSPTVPGNMCASCHERHDPGWKQVGNSEGHKVHAREEVDCKGCHANSIHEFGIEQDSCKDCHERQVVRATGMERLHCTTCHNFLTASQSLRPDRLTCLHCHDSKVKLESTFPDNAPMAAFPCFSCHKPHSDDSAGMVDCAACHKKEEEHGLHRLEAHGTCADCHKAHTWVTDRAGCVACHTGQDTHEVGHECRDCHGFSAAPNRGKNVELPARPRRR